MALPLPALDPQYYSVPNTLAELRKRSCWTYAGRWLDCHALSNQLSHLYAHATRAECTRQWENLSLCLRATLGFGLGASKIDTELAEVCRDRAQAQAEKRRRENTIGWNRTRSRHSQTPPPPIFAEWAPSSLDDFLLDL